MTEIVKLCKEHISQMAQIEKLCFSDPWSESSLEKLLAENYICFVAIVDGEVAAYISMYFVFDEGNIINVATHPNYRRRGLARELIRAISKHSQDIDVTQLYLEVRESNESAIALYSSEGWEEIGKRKNFYSHPKEDAVLMKKDLLKGS